MKDIVEDFYKMAKYQIEVGDNHPIYAVLRNSMLKESLKTKMWRCLIYVTFDHIGSAEQIWSEYPNPAIIKDPEVMDTGIARRNFRGNTKWATMINEVVQNLDMFANLAGVDGWVTARQAFEDINNNGPWASYKFADMLKNVAGLPLECNSIGENHCVLHSAELVANKPAKEIMSDLNFQKKMYQGALKHGIKFQGIDQFETALCDYISFIEGRYYVGMEIDSQMEQLSPDSKLWPARKLSFDAKFLGELNGYHGIRKELKGLYLHRGVIDWWNFIKN